MRIDAPSVCFKMRRLERLQNTGMIVAFLFSDKLGSTVFAPVKMDFVGNIKVTYCVFSW